MWDDSSDSFEEPEWVGGIRNNPISHTKNHKISATVTVKVEPPGVNFDLIGDGPDDYLDFEATGQTSTGGDQDVPVTAKADLPDRVCILEKIIIWKIKVGSEDKGVFSSGSHKIYVTSGIPHGSAETEQRVNWVCEKGGSSVSETAENIYAALASEPPRFQLQEPNVPNPLWKLMESVSYQGQCIHLAHLMRLQVEMVGGAASIGYVYGSTDSDCFSTSENAYQTRTCSNPNHSGLELIAIWSEYAAGWNSWEAVCGVDSTYYAVKEEKGSALQILSTLLGANEIGGNYQAWMYWNDSMQKWVPCTEPGPYPAPKP